MYVGIISIYYNCQDFFEIKNVIVIEKITVQTMANILRMPPSIILTQCKPNPIKQLHFPEIKKIIPMKGYTNWMNVKMKNPMRPNAFSIIP